MRYLSDFYHFPPLIGHYHPPTRYRGKKCWSHMKGLWYVHVLARRKRGARGGFGGVLGQKLVFWGFFLSIRCQKHFFPKFLRDLCWCHQIGNIFGHILVMKKNRARGVGKKLKQGPKFKRQFSVAHVDAKKKIFLEKSFGHWRRHSEENKMIRWVLRKKNSAQDFLHF